jgi:hypothetical protein
MLKINWLDHKSLLLITNIVKNAYKCSENVQGEYDNILKLTLQMRLRNISKDKSILN